MFGRITIAAAILAAAQAGLDRADFEESLDIPAQSSGPRVLDTPNRGVTSNQWTFPELTVSEEIRSPSAAAPLFAQAPPVELEDYDARSIQRPSEQAMRPSRACISTVCMLPLPDRIKKLTRRDVQTLDDMTSSFGASVPSDNPRWEPRR